MINNNHQWFSILGGGKDLVTAVTTVSAHKDGPATVKLEDSDATASSSALGSTAFPKLGIPPTAPVVKGATSILKSENPVGNPNELKTIKREYPMKIGNKLIF